MQHLESYLIMPCAPQLPDSVSTFSIELPEEASDISGDKITHIVAKREEQRHTETRLPRRPFLAFFFVCFWQPPNGQYESGIPE